MANLDATALKLPFAFSNVLREGKIVRRFVPVAKSARGWNLEICVWKTVIERLAANCAQT